MVVMCGGVVGGVGCGVVWCRRGVWSVWCGVWSVECVECVVCVVCGEVGVM